MFGDGIGRSLAFTLWLTSPNVTRWVNLGNLSKEGIYLHMVNGNRVIYNAQAHYQAARPSGLRYSYGSWCSYKWIFQDDDKFLGATSFNKIHWPATRTTIPPFSASSWRTPSCARWACRG